jgi:peptidoglycan/xylan/chitin deacetylase (PgdA/CDA1 family)
MGKAATWIACAGVAAATVGGGVLVEAVANVHGLAAGSFAVLAATYLVGTFSLGSPFFGRVARGRTDRPELALTFDDGPDPRFTPRISAMLARRGHRGTFFVLGSHAREHPQVLRQVKSEGHEIASHGDDHRLLAFSPPTVIRAQLKLAGRAVQNALGRPPAPFFRPPHGVRSPWLVSVVRRCGYDVCAWDGSVFDTAAPGVETIVARVEKSLRPGAILLLHDGDGSGRGASREQTVAALERILDALEARRLRSVALTELVSPRKVR